MIKRIMIFFLLLCALTGLHARTDWGDVDGNGTTDFIDALLILQYEAGIVPPGFDPGAADVNCDGQISVMDAFLITYYSMDSCIFPGNYLTKRIDPDNPAIYYTGRIDFSNPREPSFTYSAVSIKARFTGTGIDVILKDQSDRNYFNIIIDGGPPTVIRSSDREVVYEVARNLCNTVHTIEIIKRTEAGLGKPVFLGFNLYDSFGLVRWGRRPARKMEFIGDSITCGKGNEVSTYDPGNFPFDPANENADLAYGAIAARALDSEYWTMCYSGKGLYRNFNTTETDTIPLMYDRIFPDDPSSVWDFPSPAPDVIVINLGTNDYSSLAFKNDLTDEEFDANVESCYLGLLNDIRNRYGCGPHIICVVGPMFSDAWPEGAFAWTRARDWVSLMVNSSGDSRLHYIEYETLTPPFGEDWHPTIAVHNRMAEELAALIRQITGWDVF